MRPLRVFVVDDDRDFADSLAMVIEMQGHEVEMAFSGEEAIAKFQEQDFDITFMDVRLPGKNGVESFLEIRKLKPWARVVMMTGYSVEQLLDQAVEHGAWGVLDKPLDTSKVLEMIEEIKPDGILIVDDDPDFVESIAELLTSNGYTVFVARNGREAIIRIQSNGVDILILDIRMPVLNGLETYLELKRIDRVIPTLIVTAYADEYVDDLEELRSLSVGGILQKPLDPDELLRAIKRLADEKQE